MKLYCGIDLHANNGVYVITDENHRKLFRERLPNNLCAVLKALEPFRRDLETVAVESTYNWYWLADGLIERGYPVELVNPCAGILRLDQDQLGRLLGGDECLRLTAQQQMEIIGLLSERICLFEKKALLKPTYKLLLTMPGVGAVLSLTIFFETGDIDRFRRAGNYSSYCRAVKAGRFSNGKSKGQNNRRNGNRYLAWAFVQAAHQAVRCCPAARSFYDRKKTQCNGALATKALASKWSKAAYYVMKRQEAFDLRKVFG